MSYQEGTFMWAMQSLRTGVRRVRRKKWCYLSFGKTQSAYAELEPSWGSPALVIFNSMVDEIRLSEEDLFADDWEIMD